MVQIKTLFLEIRNKPRFEYVAKPCYKYVAKDYREDSQIQDGEAGHHRNVSPRCEKTGLPIANVEHRTVVIGVQSTVWRERGDEEFWAYKSVSHTCSIIFWLFIEMITGVDDLYKHSLSPYDMD